jgi:hypothetical protein
VFQTVSIAFGIIPVLIDILACSLHRRSPPTAVESPEHSCLLFNIFPCHNFFCTSARLFGAENKSTTDVLKPFLYILIPFAVDCQLVYLLELPHQYLTTLYVFKLLSRVAFALKWSQSVGNDVLRWQEKS